MHISSFDYDIHCLCKIDTTMAIDADSYHRLAGNPLKVTCDDIFW